MSAAVGVMVNAKRSRLRNPLRLLFSAEPWLAFVFMLLSFVLGVFWFVVLVSLIATGFGLSITFVGIPLLVATVFLWPLGARLERKRVESFLGVPIRDPYKPLPPGPWFGRGRVEGDGTPTYGTWFEKIKARFTDRYVWQDLLYLFLLSGILRGIIAALLARRVRELRKPRKEISAQALAMRITGFNAALTLSYDFIGKPPPDEDTER